MKVKKGVSLVILIITIIVMIIISGTVIISVTNIISEATKAAFYQDMKQLDEQKESSKLQVFFSNKGVLESKSSFLDRNLTTEEITNLEETLKAEIIYVRNSFGEKELFTTKQIWKNNMFECQEMYKVEEYLQGLSTDIYYISKEIYSSQDDYKFIYDSVSDTCFKISQTKIGKYVVHSLGYARFAIDGENVKGIGIIEFEAGVIKASDETLAYEPDLNNFSFATQVVYYSPDFATEYTMSIKEFVDQGRPSTKILDGQKYTFANYASLASGQTQVWANIKTTANGLDAYWVWIPRYAYKLDEENQRSDIIFVDISNKPIDIEKYGSELPEGYKLHEGFAKQDGLKGIWFSKYEPTVVETVPIDRAEAQTPDLTNFNTEELTLIYYTLDGNTSIEVEYTENPSQTVKQNGTTYYWYSYANQIWANVKTTANDLDAYWVWIPRFAYKLESGTSSVILIDTEDRPLDTATYGIEIPAGYKVHEGFAKNDGLEGIWFSKYEPTAVETAPVDQTEPESPDLTNFNTDELMLVYYTLAGNTSIEVEYTENPSQTIEQNGTTYYWYNYPNKIWANIKTTANGLDAYWVWIPRYAYKLESGQSSVILVDVNDRPIDAQKYGAELPEGYKLHEGFAKQDGLRGIWFSKYEPTKVEITTTTEE